MQATGFTTKNVSSMLSGAGKDLALGIEALVKHKPDLEALIKEGIFDAKSLSSMLHGAGKYLAAGIEALVKHKPDLEAFIKEGIFDAKSLSSMLSGAGKDLAAGIEALVKYKPDLEAIIAEGIFDAKSLSSMLHGAGKDLGQAITLLKQNKNRLYYLVRPPFTTTNISTMFSSVGIHLVDNIAVFEKWMPQLVLLCTVIPPGASEPAFAASGIATRLSGLNAKKLEETLGTMVELWKRETEGQTMLRPGANSRILDASPAALAKARKSIEKQ